MATVPYEAWMEVFGTVDVSWDSSNPDHTDWSEEFWRGFRRLRQIRGRELEGTLEGYFELPATFSKARASQPRSQYNPGSCNWYPCFIEGGFRITDDGKIEILVEEVWCWCYFGTASGMAHGRSGSDLV